MKHLQLSITTDRKRDHVGVSYDGASWGGTLHKQF